MTKRNLQDENDEQLAFDWEPSAEVDFQPIARLLRETDVPPRLSALEAEALRDAVRARLIDEGLIHPRPATVQATPGVAESFLHWLRVVFLGGGYPAQTLRFGAIAAAVWFASTDGTPPVVFPAPREERAAATVKTPGLSEPSAASNAIAQSAAAPSASDAPGTAAKARLAQAPPDIDAGANLAMLAASEAAPAQDSAVTMRRGLPAQPAAAPVVSLTPSPTPFSRFVEETNAMRAMAPAPMVAVSGNGWIEPDARGGFATQSLGSMSTAMPQNSTIAEALEQVQVLKFNAVMANDSAQQAELRRLEETLRGVISESGAAFDAPPSGDLLALESYRRADDLVRARRFSDALRLFDQARQAAPDTFTAFLAQFQIARLSYEEVLDYEAALAAYRGCLERYPAQYLTDAHRAHIIERVQLLTRTSADNWTALRLYHQSQRADSATETADLLRRIVEIRPPGALTPVAAESLANLLIADATARTVEPAPILDALSLATRSMPPGPDAARVQFALAEICLRRSQNMARALAEYRRVGELSPTDDLRALVGQRLDLIARTRLAGMGQ